MRDFIGRTITVGSFVAFSGKGNGSAEYGMILARVENITPPKIKLVRLDVYYPTNNANNAVIK